MRTVRACALLVVLALAVVSCGGDDDASAPEPRDTSASSVPASDEADAQSRLDSVDIAITPIAELDDPTAFAVRADDDTLYVTEQVGLVRAVRDDALDGTPVLDITDRVQCCGEQGLLGMAFSPNGERLYVHYSRQDGDNQIDEYEMGESAAVPSTRREVLTVEGLQANHNGGQLAFGPDGLLYIGLGDGGGAGDQGDGHAVGGNGQSLDTLLGKIVRIDPNPSGGEPYTIPPDNPFVGGDGEAEIWAYGLRNPWRFSFDRETGDLWIGDVGQNAWEEVDFVPAGEGAGVNFGWPHLEGTHTFRDDPPDGHVGPIVEYPNPDEGCTVIGGYVYRGSRIPDLDGTYLFTDYCNGTIRAITQRDGEVVAQRSLLNGPDGITAFGQDNDGELYVLAQSGGLLRIEPS